MKKVNLATMIATVGTAAMVAMATAAFFPAKAAAAPSAREISPAPASGSSLAPTAGSILAPTAGDIVLTCVTEFPTTSFVVSTEGEEVVARVIHHNGSGYAPAFSGTFTPNDLKILAERGELVRKMKPDMTFRWPLSKCKKLGSPLVFQCFGTEDVQEGEDGAKIAPFALYSTAKTEDGIAGHYDWISVAMTFDVDGAHGASIEMTYPKSSCWEAKMDPMQLASGRGPAVAAKQPKK